MNDELNNKQAICINYNENKNTKEENLNKLCKVTEDLLDITGKVVGKINKLDDSNQINIEIYSTGGKPNGDDEDDDDKENN